MDAATFTRHRARAVQAFVVVVVLLGAASTASACARGQAVAPGATTMNHQTMAPVAETPSDGQSAAQSAAWAARPDFTRLSSSTEAAYHYALTNSQILHWIPCYCGCGPIGHRSNLDCYYEPHADGAVVFEEHASYCSICIDITLRTEHLAAQGTPLATIRAVIDAEFGAGGYGTDTPYPES